jgi:hypothetical protein
VRGGHAPKENHIFVDNVGGVAPGGLILAGRMHLMGLDIRLKFRKNSPVTKGAMGAQKFSRYRQVLENRQARFLLYFPKSCLLPGATKRRKKNWGSFGWETRKTPPPQSWIFPLAAGPFYHTWRVHTRWAEGHLRSESA